MKRFLFVCIFLISLIVTWKLLPFRVRYYKEISIGDDFANNIKKYYSKNNELPKKDSAELLMILNPKTGYDVLWPQYLPYDSANFYLIYMEGFDGPYLRYDSKEGTWDYR